MKVSEKKLEAAYEIASKIALVGVDVACPLTDGATMSQFMLGLAAMSDDEQTLKDMDDVVRGYENRREAVRLAAASFKNEVERMYHYAREMQLPDVPDVDGVCFCCAVPECHCDCECEKDASESEQGMFMGESEQQFNDRVAKEEKNWI